ncbi:hydrogenase expression/formation protein HypD [Clostridium acetobutylicum]|uniref:Hydrogenase expression-formation factor (HypD) n=1 Tax=Clostridium acetobutylicum (strain ATCC 824 / DSM 792 / JCM 1419 / IAM 19013 / LMG 5710 / NBRC 13948 / NRRL B-527 / VKM B-1787 / 2291 / W) TaxID=272562 RepID=Q97KV5_CLOAB|nr:MULTISPECIES: hydrogenase formation protein HypD [Clostridium]AAK78787.1 Hydrogenase expression-formation factor (hypD) [Clostridium acetobutylicum ATCC 824]ADZ19861.1 Hydrogenase expression-formation factor (hypD) [Clostridium acetobutylicum EA 2018]AEI33541.1 hydrogenase expression-formation factor (hypD) [Clostridium acetobutylicum DSM 1731]AWV80505.1 hydrogenase formation protein HypD [Clostridium acetobutylicum]MBC2392696.1 hydrogenase formation protein HypD [Clostridium acetobutylicum
MKYVDEFRNGDYAKTLVRLIQKLTKKKINIMEICGSHTMAIFRYGIKDILPSNIRLISGPGCPVCVTSQGYIDTALELSLSREVIIATFGDMIRVPGTKTSLMKRKAEGADIKIVYSPMDALTLAENNPLKKVVFLSVGFETTTPITAITILEAKKRGVKNIFFLTSNKMVPPVMRTLVEDKELNITGFLLPGNVSAIIGKKPYEFLSSEYNVSGVVTGFEPLDILKGLKVLIDIINNNASVIVNEYKRVVRDEGNVTALRYIKEVFEVTDSTWRGIGNIEKSGYKINTEYEQFDAVKQFNINYKECDSSSECRCGDILKGKITPIECSLFKKACTPDHPVGSCMVSYEGVCAAYYKFLNT